MQLPADHRTHPEGIEYVEVAGDQAAMREWVGSSYYSALPIRWASGSPRIVAAGIKTSSGTVVLT